MCDEGIWHYIGRLWIDNDMPPYKYSIENKNPAIFELYALSDYLFGSSYMFVRLLGIFAVILSMNIVRKISELLHSKTAGIYVLYIYGLTSAWYLLDGQWPSVTENFMCLFYCLAFYYLIKSGNHKKKNYFLFLTGIFTGIAISFKQIALFGLLGLLIYYLINQFSNKSLSQHSKSIFLIAIGTLFSSVIFLLPVFFSGVSLKEYFDGAWLILLNPGSSNSIVERLYLSIDVWFESRITIFWLIIPMLMYQKDLIKKRYFIGLLSLLILDFIGANASGNFYGHQIKQIIPSISIITAILLSQITIKLNKNITQFKTNVWIMIISIIILLFPYHNVIINGYFSGFPDNEKELGLWIKNNSDETDYIYVVAQGGSGPILSYSERVSASKYINIFFTRPNHIKEQVLLDIASNKPKYLIVNYGYGKKWIEGSEGIMNNYSFQFRNGLYEVYLLKNKLE